MDEKPGFTPVVSSARNILLVEPDPLWGLAVQQSLVRQGYNVDRTPTPVAAVGILHRRTYDLFILSTAVDAMALESMVREIRARYFRPRLVLVLPARDEDRSEPWRVERATVLRRPCPLEKIASAVRFHLDSLAEGA